MKKLTPKNLLIIASSIIGTCFLLAFIGSCIPDPETDETKNRNQSIDLTEPTNTRGPTEPPPSYANTPIPTATNLPTVTKISTSTTAPTATLAKLISTATKALIKATATNPTRLKPTATTKPVKKPTATKSSSTKCHKSYPTVCIPPPPPDLDCKDISYRRFKVIPPDPHNFDTDGDGIGCEN